MARSVFQYEQPRCPDNWNEAERRFYNRLIETLDDIYSKYGRLDEKMLSKGVLNRIDNSTVTSLEKMTADILSSGKIAADSIEATFAYLVSLSAKYGSFDFETVKNLVADAMVLEKGQADYVHITNLAATYAQAVNATIGNLVIQSSDGKYYQLDVSADGKVSASEVKPSDKEISAGETSEGKVIVGTHITAETLGTATLAATQALINMIDASRINVDTLVAREEFVQTLTANEAFVDSLVANTAFIKQLGTTTIVGDKSITMLAGEVDNLDRLSNIEVIEGTFAQTERREGEGIRIYSEIRSKQDLKWGAPWPGGGGKNLCSFDEYTTPSSGNYSTGYMPRPALTPGASVMIHGQTTDGVVLNSGNCQLVFTGAAGTAGDEVWMPNPSTQPQIVPNGYVNAVQFRVYTTSALAGKTIRIMLETGTAASEWQPYANTPPIEGWTGLNAGHRGKNLCGSAEDIVVQNGPSKATMTQNGNVFTLSTTSEYGGDGFFFGYGVFKKGKKYTVSGTVAGYANVRIYDKTNMNAWLHSITPDANGNFALTFEATSDNVVFRVWVSVSAACTLSNFQIEEGDLTPYAPYQGNTYFLDFGETVYGGKVDWHAGEMTVEWAFAKGVFTRVGLDSSGKLYSVAGIPSTAKPYDTTTEESAPNIVCTALKFRALEDARKYGEVCIVQYGRGIYIGGYVGREAELDALIASDDFAVAYKLAEPYTIQLTPVQIETLQGINTVYTDADGGRVEFGHSPIEDIHNAVDALEEAQAESALYLKLDAENKVVRIGQTEVTSEFDIDAYGAGVGVGGKVFSRFEGERVLIGGMEMRKPANIGGLAFDSIMTWGE